MPRYTKRADGRFCKTITVEGKKHYFYGKTQKEAQQKATDFLLAPKKVQKNKMPLKFAIEQWQEEHLTSLSPTTQKGYKRAISRAIERFGDSIAEDITTKDIENYLKVFGATHTQKTVKHQLSVFNLIFKFCVENGYCKTNPCERVKINAVGNKGQKRRALNDAEIEIINNNNNTEMGYFAYFLLYTGLRRGEALALQFKDIDLKKKVIHVTKSVYYENNKPKIKTPKTSAGTRDVILLDRIAATLPQGQPEHYLFHDDLLTERMHSRRVDERWAHYVKAVGLPSEITPHYLRHTYATILYRQKVDVKTAQHLLGHADIQTTMNIYTHIAESMLDEARQKLNDF